MIESGPRSFFDKRLTRFDDFVAEVVLGVARDLGIFGHAVSTRARAA